MSPSQFTVIKLPSTLSTNSAPSSASSAFVSGGSNVYPQQGAQDKILWRLAHCQMIIMARRNHIDSIAKHNAQTNIVASSCLIGAKQPFLPGLPRTPRESVSPRMISDLYLGVGAAWRVGVFAAEGQRPPKHVFKNVRLARFLMFLWKDDFAPKISNITPIAP
ncbi:hypothetical protein D9619_011252 [Psilocybe cf. subviscida]|uniref:Uncharacterized protein n=1 Tax=Psilocybe cf. subviscida TaxID=2480587 RepID=A0A8H5F583_9AGAR|nr:hypothetical protein D9619_011252 [Psilocybe cf. subviscida]